MFCFKAACDAFQISSMSRGTLTPRPPAAYLWLCPSCRGPTDGSGIQSHFRLWGGAAPPCPAVRSQLVRTRSVNDTHGGDADKTLCDVSVKTQLAFEPVYMFHCATSWCVRVCDSAITPGRQGSVPRCSVTRVPMSGGGLSCIGWGQIRSGTPGAKGKCMCVKRVCVSERGCQLKSPWGSQSSSLQATAIASCLITLRAIAAHSRAQTKKRRKHVKRRNRATEQRKRLLQQLKKTKKTTTLPSLFYS